MFLIGLGAYGVVDFFWIRPTLPPREASVSNLPMGEDLPVAPAEVQGPIRSLSDYLAAVAQRNPFTGLAVGSGPVQVSPLSTQRHLEELTKSLVVVGIDRGPNPAALVEDTQRNQTLILHAGDEIDGMKVKEITPEGVLLSYEGKELLLR